MNDKDKKFTEKQLAGSDLDESLISRSFNKEKNKDRKNREEESGGDNNKTRRIPRFQSGDENKGLASSFGLSSLLSGGGSKFAVQGGVSGLIKKAGTRIFFRMIIAAFASPGCLIILTAIVFAGFFFVVKEVIMDSLQDFFKSIFE